VPAILSYLGADELAERLAWVKKLIGLRKYLPGEPGKSWAGQNDVIGTSMSQFSISEDEGRALVGLAAAELWEAAALGESPLLVRKQVMVEALEDMARVCEEEQAKDVIVELTYQFEQQRYPELNEFGEPHPRAGEKIFDEAGKPVMLRVPHRRKELPQDKGSWVRLRLDVYRQIAGLLGLEGGQGQGETSTAALLEEIHEAGSKKTRTLRSIAHTVKTSAPEQMNPRSRAEYERVVREAVAQQGGASLPGPASGKKPAGKSRGHGGPGRKKK